MGDLVLGPCVKFALGVLLDPKRRVVVAQAVVDSEVNQNLELLQHAVGRAGRLGALGEDAPHVLARHFAHEAMADGLVDDQTLDHRAVGLLCRRREAQVLGRAEVILHEPVERAWCAALLRPLLRHFADGCPLVGSHELWSAWPSGQWNARTAVAPEVVALAAVTVDEPVDVSKLDQRHW